MVGGGGDNDSGSPQEQQPGCALVVVEPVDAKEQEHLPVNCAKTTTPSSHHHEVENENSASFSESSPRRLNSRSNAATLNNKMSVPLSLIDGKPNMPQNPGHQQHHESGGESDASQQQHQSQQQLDPTPASKPPPVFFPPPKGECCTSGSSSAASPDHQQQQQPGSHPQQQPQPHAVYSRSFPSVGLLSIASTLSEDSILYEQPGQVPSDEEGSSSRAGNREGLAELSQGELREGTTTKAATKAVTATQLDTGVLRSWKHDEQARDIFRPGQEQDEECPEDEAASKRSRVSRGSSSRKGVRSRLVSSIKAGLGSVLLRGGGNGATPPLVPKKSTEQSVSTPNHKSECETASMEHHEIEVDAVETSPCDTPSVEKPETLNDELGHRDHELTTVKPQEEAIDAKVESFEIPNATPQISLIDGTEQEKSSSSTAVVDQNEATEIDEVTMKEEQEDAKEQQKTADDDIPTVKEAASSKSTEDPISQEGPAPELDTSRDVHEITADDESGRAPDEVESRVKITDEEVDTSSEVIDTVEKPKEDLQEETEVKAIAADEDDKAPPSLTKSIEEEHSSIDSSDIEVYNPIISGSSTSGDSNAPSRTKAPVKPLLPDDERVASAAVRRANVASTKDEYEWAYHVWIRKGLLSEEAMADKLSKTSTPCIDEELDKKLRKRRESVDAQIARNVQQRRVARQSMPALPVSASTQKAGYRRSGGKDFANVLSQWKTKTAGRPDAEELPDDRLQQPFKTVTNPVNNITATAIATLGDRSKQEKLHRTEPRKNRASSSPIPMDRAVSPVRSAPRSQAWKLKMETEKRVAARRSKRSVPTPPGSLTNTKPAVKNSVSRAQSVPRHQQEIFHACSSSNGRPPSTGRSSRLSDRDRQRPQRRRASSRASSGEESPVQIDKYTPRAQSLPRRKRAPSPLPSGVPATISISTPTKALSSAPGSTVETESNTLKHSLPEASMTRITDLAMMSNMNQLFAEDPIQRDRSDSSSSVANSIPKEVNVSAKKLKRLSSSQKDEHEAIEKDLQPVYPLADVALSPSNNGCSSERPWRRDTLLARVTTQPPAKTASECHCVCSDSVFSGNDVMIEFFLPLMGAACTCGKKHPGLISPEDPTALVNILRPWQVSFLRSCGIYRGDELVKVNHRNGSALASVMRQYRKDRGMAPFRTKSCGMALQIWSKTSKAFVRSIRSQMKAAENLQGEGVQLEQAREIRLPNALYIVSAFLDNIPSDCISQGPDSAAHSASDSGTSVASSISVSRSSFDMTEPQIEEAGAGRSLILRSGRRCEAEI